MVCIRELAYREIDTSPQNFLFGRQRVGNVSNRTLVSKNLFDQILSELSLKRRFLMGTSKNW